MTATGSIVIAGRLLLEEGLVPGVVRASAGRIVEVRREPSGVAPKGTRLAAIVAPGLIDLQVNGGFGIDLGPDPETLRRLAARLPETGVTSFLPTAIAKPIRYYEELVAAFSAARDAKGARPLGLHLEGPLLSPDRAGAHEREHIEAADLARLERVLESDALRLMTIAPERVTALDWIRRLTERGVAVSLGHTDASYEAMRAGADAGATLVTHLFSAMSPFHHRAPGAVGAALTDPRLTVSLIADGVHCHPAALALAVLAKGARGIALSTDAMAAAGMGPGSYELGGRKVVVDATSARLADGTLAGSLLTLDRAVRNMVSMGHVDVADALRMASETPARLLSLTDKGRIAIGCDADLVLFDDDLRVTATYVGGEQAYACSAREAGAAKG